MNRAVKRAYHLNIQSRRLFEQGLYLHAVLADYIGIIPSRVGEPLGFKIYLVGENIAAKSAEGTKRVRAVKDPVQRVICLLYTSMLGMHEQGGKFVSVKLKPKQHAQSHVVDSAGHSPVHGLGMISVIVLRPGWMQPFIAFPMV